MSADPVRLAFVGDIMLGRHIDERLATTKPDAFWNDVLPVLQATDAVIGNLECPITSYRRQWRRTLKAFRFRARPSARQVLTAANVRLVNLANNHILDYREQGLSDTIAHLELAGIGHAGAGGNAYQAAAPAFATVAGARIGMIGLTDNMPEWAAGHAAAGTNYVEIRNDNVTLTLLRSLIREARHGGAEIVVLSCHWGPNLRTFPPRRFRDFARHAIEFGASVVHGHSAHLPQAVELHRDGLILYDTGDILDDYWVFPGIRIDRSFVFSVEFEGGRFRRLAMRPIAQDRTSVRLAKGAEFDAVCRAMLRRCRPFGTAARRCAEGLEVLAPEVDRRPGVAPAPAATAALCNVGGAT